MSMIKDQLRRYSHRNPNDDFKFGHYSTISREKELDVINKWIKSIVLVSFIKNIHD